jgi:hypothetical protein
VKVLTQHAQKFPFADEAQRRGFVRYLLRPSALLPELRSNTRSLPASSSYFAEYVYEVEGVVYRRGMNVYERAQIGDRFILQYDPDNPFRNSVPENTLCFGDRGGWTFWSMACAIIVLFLYLLAKYF